MNKKKSGISGILADSGNYFFNPSWLPILLKILLFLGFFYFSKGVKKKFLHARRKDKEKYYFT